MCNTESKKLNRGLRTLLYVAMICALLFSCCGATAFAESFSFTITYQSGEDGEFSDGTTANAVTYIGDDIGPQYSHTANISDDGTRAGNYANKLATIDVITVPNAAKIKTTITYGTENNYDYVFLFNGTYSGSVNKNITGYVAKHCGGNNTLTTKSYITEGDTVSLAFCSDSSNAYYGYYAVIEGYEWTATSGEYKEPVPYNSEYSFSSWNTSPDGSGDAIVNSGQVNGDTSVYAVYIDTWDANASGDWWKIKPDGTLIIGTGGEMTMPVSGDATDGTQYPWHSYRSVITSVQFNGTVHSGDTTAGMFRDMTNCSSIDLSGFDTSASTDMSYMFYRCSVLPSLDLSGINTSNVTAMMYTFGWTSQLSEITFGSGFDTGNTETMEYLFAGTGLTSFDLSIFDTSSLINMKDMFFQCSKLTSVNASGIDTSNVTTMQGLFNQCTSLTEITFGQNFSTANVTNMMHMFASCSKLTSLDLSMFNTEKVETMANMFNGCSKLQALDVTGFNVSRVTTTESMFESCTSLASLDLSTWTTSSITNMKRMFAKMDSLSSLNVRGLDTSHATSFEGLFFGSSYSTYTPKLDLDLSSWDVSKVTKMYSMFEDNSRIRVLNIAGWNTESLTDIRRMFQDAKGHIQFDPKWLNVSKCTSFAEVFYGAGFDSLDLSSWDTGSVTTASQMFFWFGGSTLNLGNWDVDQISNFSNFMKNSYISSLDLSGWDNNASATPNTFFFQSGTSGTPPKKIVLSSTWKWGSSIAPNPTGNGYTGYWVREDDPETYGPLTSEELKNQWTADMAGTWVWEETPTKYTITFEAPDGATGDMPPQKVVAAQSGTINANAFMWFDREFDHWEAYVNGSETMSDEYADKATIPANTYAIGDSVLLKAVFTRIDHSVNLEDGVFDFYLGGGETAIFDSIPAGTSYQVWEETEDGWILIESSETAGDIAPLTESSAYFLNKYLVGTTSSIIVGNVRLDYKSAKAGQFHFELWEDDGTGMPWLSGGEPIQSLSNATAGYIKFNDMQFTEDDLGGEESITKTYLIRELLGDDPTIIYDQHIEKVTVELTSDGTNLSAATIYWTDGSEDMGKNHAQFDNFTRPGTLYISKSATGATEATADTEFTFVVTIRTPDGAPADVSGFSWYLADAVPMPDDSGGAG